MAKPIQLGRVGAYSVLGGTFVSLFAGFLAWRRQRGVPLPERIEVRDVALIGIATHKISEIVTRDRVASPLRAPFTENAGAPMPGSTRPLPRGDGLRRAIGELITCPFCTGVWIAAGLTYGLAAAPREARLLTSIFASVAVADFCHRGYRSLANLALATTPPSGPHVQIIEPSGSSVASISSSAAAPATVPE